MSALASVADLAAMTDHSLVHPTITDAQLIAGLEMARDHGCATACVKPYAVPIAASALAGSATGVCTVAGFPHGNGHIAVKVAEATRAIEDGATEIDAVVNVGKVLGGDWDYVEREVEAVNRACTDRGAILKVIFENDYLEDAHIVRLCELCTDHDVAFVKTSSGFGFTKQASGDYNYHGATDHHLELMRRHAGPRVKVKAAGGIRTLDDLLRVRALGVTRIGATATKSILADAVRRGFPGPFPPALVDAGAK